MEEPTHDPWISSKDEHTLKSKFVVNGHALEAKTCEDDSVMEDSQEKEIVYVSEGNTESMIIMEDKPPSPLSVQQGGGISLVESPPFEADQDDNSSPDRAPISHQSDNTLFSVPGVNVDGEDSVATKTCMTTTTATTATTTWVSDANSGQSSSMEVQQQRARMLKSPSWSGPSEQTVTGVSHTLSNQIGANGDGLPANQQPQQPRSGPMKKSIRELYGRPSWWGDDDDDREHDAYSGRRFSTSNRKAKEETSRMSHPAEELTAQPPNPSKQVMNSRENLSEQYVRPRAEAFIIDFGTGLATTDDNPPSVSGTLSECVPERLRRGFDERERLKREREKENQLRRQMSTDVASKTPKSRVTSGTKPALGKTKPIGRSVVTKTPLTTTTAASKSNVVRAGTGASSKAVSRGGGLSGRPQSSAVGGRIKTALSAANTPRGSSTPGGGGRNLAPRCAPSSAEVTQAARRLLSSNQSSPFRRTMSAKGSCSVAPSLTNSPCTPKNIAGATRTRISSNRPGMHVSGSPCSPTTLTKPATTRRISGSTNASALSRQTAPALAGKGIISPVKTTIRSGVNTPLTSARGGTTVSRGSTARRGTVTTSTTHNFMSATASSGAKRVVLRNNNNNNNQPNAELLLSGRGRPSRGPVLGNSAKKPVTSTQLRRPPSSSRTVPVRLQRQLSETVSGSVDKRKTGSRGSMPRTSDLTASIMAAIESYEDPKDYLFYRMFQGHEQTEVGVDNDVFKLFAGETPSEALADVDKEVYETAGLGMKEAILAQSNTITSQAHQTAAELRAVTAAGSLLPIPQSETAMQLASVTTVDSGITGSALVDSSPRTRQAYQHVQWNTQTHGRPGTTNTVCPTSEQSSATPLEPLVSSYSPSMQRRQHRVDMKGLLPSERETLGDSMLVSTSVTSLTPSNAGTYIINPDDTMAAHGLLRREDISKINQDATLQEIPEPESLTPRGSQTNLSGVSDPFDLTSKEHSVAKGKSTNDEALLARASGLHSDRSRPLSCLAIVRDRDVDLSASLNLPNSSVALHTTTASTSSLVETCKNDRDLDRTEAPLLSVGGVNSSMNIGASVASLTPSCAGTYVLDVDETLAARGIPPVVIQSRENLSSQKGPQSTNHVQTQEAITPRRSSPCENREGLWDVLEAEECTEDFVLLGSTDVTDHFPTNVEKTDTAQINTAINFESRVNMGEINEDEAEEDDYKLLPNPSNASLVQLENTRTANQLQVDERISADNEAPTPSEGSNRTWLRLGKGVTPIIQGSATPSLVQDETDKTLLCESSTKPREGTNNKLEGSQSNPNASNWSNRITGNSVALRLPDRSPSSISSPSSSPSSTANNASKNRGQESENLRNEATSPSGGDTSGPLSYAPLTDIHNCYRALQESVNYLLQSQNGSLQTSQIDQPCNLVGSAQPGEENIAMPIRISCFSDRSAGLYKHSADIAPTTTDARLASPGAAIWPSDMSECLRHTLTSRRAHHDRRHNSTASLDTALQRWDYTSTEPGNVYRRSFRFKRSVPDEKRRSLRTVYGSTSLFEDEHVSTVSADAKVVRCTAATHSESHSPWTLLQTSEKHCFEGSATVPAIAHRSQNIHSVTVHPGSSSVPELASPVHSVPYPLSGSMYQGGAVRENQQVRAVCWAPSGGSLAPTCNDRPVSLAFGPTNPDPQRSVTQFAGHVLGENEYPIIDSRTFTRRKASQIKKEIQAAGDHPAHFDADSYHAWIEGMTAISQGIETLAKTPIFQPINSKPNSRTKTEPVTCERILTTKERAEHVSDLPDSTTGPSLIEPVRSAFVTPLPQRSFAMINAPSDVQLPCPGYDHQSSTSPMPKIGKSCPNASPRTEPSISEGSESTMYYSLMVNSIRQLSLKLRQCSDNLIQRINAEQVNSSASSRTPGSRLSRTSSTDSVPSSTKYALSDALSNMQTINEQLRIVDKLLFSTDSNDLSQANSSLEGRFRNLEKTNRNLFTFLPIEKSVAAEDDARPDQPSLTSFKQAVSTNGTSINNARWYGTNREASTKLSQGKSPVTNTQQWIYGQKVHKDEPEGKQITNEHFHQAKTTQLENDNDEEEYY